MLRINYTFDNKYLLTLTGRRDGYSGFGEDKKWGVFPSVALGWNLHRESFMEGLSFVSEMKLRASYGSNGNQAVAAYESISRMGEQNIVSLGSSLPGYVPDKIGQPDLGWETSKVLNIGLDFGLLDNKVSGTINIYDTDTYDLLLNRTISPIHGFTNITQNIGKTNNKGVEFSVSSFLISGKDFSWRASGNMAFNKNRIVSLYGEKDENGKEIDDVANSWFIGRPVLVNYDFLFDGIWQLNEAEEAAAWDSAEPGDAKVRDLDGDGVRSQGDRAIIGQLDPKMTWGLTNTLTYKNWGLNLFIHGVQGITKLNDLLQDASTSAEVRRNIMKKDWWTPENATNSYFRNNKEAKGAPMYEDASFIRIKDITLYYNLPARILDIVGLDRLRIYAIGRNLFTITKWTASDPELDFGRGAAPLAKEFVFGLNFDL